MKIGIDASKLETVHKTGTEYYATVVIRGLLQSIPDTHEIILYSHKALSQDILALHPNVTNRVIRSRYLWTLWGLSWELLTNPVDVFYTPASILPPIHPKKSILVVHGLEYEAFPQAYSLFRFWHLALFTQLSAEWASTVITPTQSTREDLSSEYGIELNKINVVLSGIPESDISTEADQIRQEITLFKTEQYILMIGRKELRKNIITLIEAFNQVKKTHSQIKLILAGEPGYGYKDIKKTIEKSEYSNDIIELGRVTDKEKDILYQYAHIVAYPSYYEGFGFPILEALQYGATVLASDIPSSQEIGEDMIEYIQTEDILAWAQAIQNTLNTPITAEIKKQRKEYVTKFNFADTIQKTQNIILS